MGSPTEWRNNDFYFKVQTHSTSALLSCPFRKMSNSEIENVFSPLSELHIKYAQNQFKITENFLEDKLWFNFINIRFM